MDREGIFDKLYTGIDFIYRLLYLNVLWFGFTLIGLVIAGFGPSTLALFDTIRRWFMSGMGNDKELFLFYYKSYKKHFISGNIMGWSVLLISYVLLVNYRFTNFRMEGIFQVVNVMTVVVAVACAIVLAYLIPLFVHYDLQWKDYLKKAVILAVIQPLPTFLIVLWMAIVLYIAEAIFPYSLLLFSSSFVYGIMGLTYSSFKRNEIILNNKNEE